MLLQNKGTEENIEFLQDVSPTGSGAPLKLVGPIHRSNHIIVACHCFQIKGEAFMTVSYDKDKLKTLAEALTSFSKELWMKVVEEEKKSMRINKVCIDLLPNRRVIINK